jgi:hypothetical protein
MFCFFRFCTFFSWSPIHSSVSVTLRLLFFPPAPRHTHVSSLISFCSPGPPDRSKIVIFDLPDQPFNIHSKETGSLMHCSLLPPPSTLVTFRLFLRPSRHFSSGTPHFCSASNFKLNQALSDVAGVHPAIKQLSCDLNTALEGCPIKPSATQQVGTSRPR